jgi:hypothetical protein
VRAAAPFVEASFDQPGEWEAIRAQLPPHTSVLFVTASTEEGAGQLGEQLRELGQLQPDAGVVVLGLGPVGKSAVLAALVNHCSRGAAQQLAVPRDAIPFCASSQLGLVYPAESTDIPFALARVQQFFEGNFRFLSLAQEVVTHAQITQGLTSQVAEREQRLTEAENKLAQMEKKLAHQAAQISIRDEALTSLTQSRGWRVLQMLRRVRIGLMPRSSRSGLPTTAKGE